MPNKKISELTSATPTSTSVVPASNSAGSATNKITLQSILDLEARWDSFKPAAPTAVTPTAGNAEVSLSWTAPTGTLSVVPLTDYTIQYSSNSGSTWSTFSHAASTATSATVTSLTNGTEYVFRVAAVNAIGTGAFSNASSSSTPSGGGSDPSFASVSALLHCDGTDGSQSFVDSSSHGATVSYSGTVSLSTAQKQFGTASCLVDNGYFGAGYIQLPADSRFNFGSGDFTIEFWIRFNSVSADQRIAGGDTQMYSGYYNWAIYMPSSGSLAYFLGNSGYSWDIASAASIGSVSTNTWYHVVLQRSGNTFSPYLNGVRGTQTTSSSSLYDNYMNGPFFGAQGSSAGYFYIDDIRITKGVARYSGATFSVPTAAFPNS
jgi:hypothetical protein